ncbi:MAG: biotin transporter BioY [bacterium]|nr:biotin transporter BioY [bacterium]
MENTVSGEKQIINVKQLALTGLMTAVLCILSPFALHIPFSPVPISLGFLAIYFVTVVSGLKIGTASVFIYILLGLVGVPVFTDFTAGPGKLLGPTGGYIIGYLFMAPICGFFADRFRKRPLFCVPGMILGTCACYLFGTLWLGRQMNLSFPQALLAGVVPYLPGDAAKLALALVVGSQIRRRLNKAGII